MEQILESSNRFFSSKKMSQFVCVGPVPPSLSINPLWLEWLLHFSPSLAASEFVESVMVFRQEYRHEKSTSNRIEISVPHRAINSSPSIARHPLSSSPGPSVRDSSVRARIHPASSPPFTCRRGGSSTSFPDQ
ncbi:cytosine-specific methyltransferase [Striga asiatica]|uniref:Cytosine-specific methyltransferase n=1 Tax=Striga asiatica TaxID=4170 RepID=A0A5A7P9N6_STRAF|nr:cytosine-specific methyltransferase [Striga asiatica]